MGEDAKSKLRPRSAMATVQGSEEGRSTRRALLVEHLGDCKKDYNLWSGRYVTLVARKKGVEKELSRRDRLLKQIVQLSKK